MLPSSLEYDGTIWWRVDDLWWSFLSAWSLPCLANFASWAVHEHLVSYVVLLSHPLVMPSFCPFFCGSWHFVWTFCISHYFIPVKACSPLSRIFPFLCTIRIVTRSSLVNHSWFLLILGRWIGVHWRCKFKFLLDGLYLLAAWRRVVLLCLPAVLMVEEGTSLVLAWKLHLQWLKDVIL